MIKKKYLAGVGIPNFWPGHGFFCSVSRFMVRGMYGGVLFLFVFFGGRGDCVLLAKTILTFFYVGKRSQLKFVHIMILAQLLEESLGMSYCLFFSSCYLSRIQNLHRQLGTNWIEFVPLLKGGIMCEILPYWDQRDLYWNMLAIHVFII